MLSNQLFQIVINYFQPSRFKLNHSTNTKGTTADHALWVGDLSADVDDYGLYKCFAAKYNTVQLAKGKSYWTTFFINFRIFYRKKRFF